MSTAIEKRTIEISAENLSIEVLIERIVFLELDLKMAKEKQEQSELLLALEAVDVQKSLDPTTADVDSDEYIEIYEAK